MSRIPTHTLDSAPTEARTLRYVNHFLAYAQTELDVPAEHAVG